ncbi:DUF5696 domain-containing protein [Falsibacillus albus]|uniref:Uncharacterized protein n=1 Tax=Falsibacillus albus TaxID=2478915 RepID=A0A3L7K2P6_9BACI|nr:DUF5696 domain-containing protein [Falsibacillus albus]RLQ96619.1 hypothetical protein D9X91_05805 [Falsibacillus albus]
MYKKILLVLALLILPLHAIAEQSSKKTDPPVQKEGKDNGFEYGSPQYTRPETETAEVKTQIQKPSFNGYEKAAENDDFALYVEPESLAIKLLNKKTNYVWQSGLDHPDQYRLNKTWTQMAQSAITLDFLDRRGKVRTESILTNKSRPKITKKKDGFQADVYMKEAKLDFELDVTLEDDGVTVSIPYSKIKEDKRSKLVSMRVYPFFGAVNEDDENGYMFIPDGSGALIRYEKSSSKADAPFIGSIFGNDAGIQKNIKTTEGIVPVQPIKMPVFGAVHGVKQNGFVAVVEDGAPYGDIMAYPSGVSTDFNWIASQFHYRYEYFQPTSKDRKGITVYQKNANRFDVKLKYKLLSGKDADYVGMAKAYQNDLLKNHQLVKRKDDADIRLDFFGGESKKGLLWDQYIPMTEISRLPQMTDELKSRGVDNMFVLYKGWSEGGYTGTLPAKFPVEGDLGSKGDVQNTIADLNKSHIPIYFSSDYTEAYEGGGGFSGSKDVAKKISSETISHQEGDQTIYYLSPWKSMDMLQSDVGKFHDYGIKNVAIDSTGYKLFSDFSKTKSSTRAASIDEYHRLFGDIQKKIGNLALYEPNMYAWKDTNKYLDVPMYSSNYVFVTDTVPFVQIVLKGIIPLYAPYSNYFSDREDQVLRLIEFGVYPSFLLTDKPSRLLHDTESKDIYTSEFSTWKSEVVKEYKMIKDTLGKVEGETIVGRSIPKQGIVKVDYSNGVSIIVNYTDAVYQTEGTEVQPKGFAVIKGGAK